MKVERIGDRLVNRGVISPDQLEFALKEQKRTGERLGTILRQLNLITEDDLAKALAEAAGIEHLSVALAIYMLLYQMMASLSRK